MKNATLFKKTQLFVSFLLYLLLLSGVLQGQQRLKDSKYFTITTTLGSSFHSFFTWPSQLRHFLKCLPLLSSREQPLLLALAVFHVGGVKQRPGEDYPRSNILQLNTEGITEDKISVIEQLAYKNKAFIIVLQETHCTTADKLVIPNF